MPPVESYQRLDLNDNDKSSRQIEKKSLDQTHSEARIENRSVRDNIEDANFALSATSVGENAGKSGEVVSAAPPVRGKADPVSSAIDHDFVHHSPATVEQSESWNASVNVDKAVEGNNDTPERLIERSVVEHPLERSVDQSSDAEFHIPGGDHESAVGKDGVIVHGQHHVGEMLSTSVPTSGFGATNDALAEQSTNLEEDVQIDSIDNLTVEQAFDFLTEQTEDNYVLLP